MLLVSLTLALHWTKSSNEPSTFHLANERDSIARRHASRLASIPLGAEWRAKFE